MIDPLMPNLDIPEKSLKGLIDNLIQSFQTLSILTKTHNFVPKKHEY